MATERCYEDSEMTSLAHFDNETAIAAVEEIWDGEQKQEIESVIDMIDRGDVKLVEHEVYSSHNVRIGVKRYWSDEWKDLCYGPSGESVDTLPNNSPTNMLRRKPKKRLFAHRYHSACGIGG